MTKDTYSDRLFVAFLEEWNLRHPEGTVIDNEIQRLVERYLDYARTMGAEAYIANLSRNIELTVKENGAISYKKIMEVIRQTPVNSEINSPGERINYMVTPEGEIKIQVGKTA